MAFLKLALLGLALVGLVGAALLNVAIAVLSRDIPNLPLNVRINPFNMLAYSDQWTPEIRAVNRWAVRAMILFIASVVAYLGVALVELGRQ